MFNEMNYIKLCKNKKTPISKFKDLKHHLQLTEINLNLYNVGILAGANNLLILDIDIKNDGMKEWLKYTSENNEIDTRQHITPSGGFHYFFLEQDIRYNDVENKLISRLKNKSLYRGVGVDMRKGNGYSVAPPSAVDGLKYKVLNDKGPQLITKQLLDWILEFEDEKQDKTRTNEIIILNLDKVKMVLKYMNNTTSKEWHIITTALKNINGFGDEVKEIWKKWSKTQEGYNKENNNKKYGIIQQITQLILMS